MNFNRFIRNFLGLREALQTQNFSTKELNNLCMQGAIEYEKLYLQELQVNLEQAKLGLEQAQLKAKLEIDAINAKHQLEATKAQMLNTLIQCESMLRSLKDNAAINRANAYVSFLQVVGNATNESAIAAHASNVIRTINRIGLDDRASPLEGELARLGQELQGLAPFNGVALEVQIYAQSLETLPDHPIRIWGTSTISNAHNSFSCNGRTFEGNFMLFKQSRPDIYRVTFNSQGTGGSASQSLDILVSPESSFNLK